MNARLQSFLHYQALELERFRVLHHAQRRGAVRARSLEEIERDVGSLLTVIEPAIRNRISLLIRNGQPTALVPLEDECYCGGCHRRLTAREAQLVRLGDVVTCERCNRLIYDGQEAVGAA
ncbi:hypothetical protein HS125_12525 [bacterium]|nr:hypothetical protein [bacterium]